MSPGQSTPAGAATAAGKTARPALDAASPTQASGPANVLILDTNAVLDLWWFEDPGARALRVAIERGRFMWLATPRMLDEVRRVVVRPSVACRARYPAAEADAVAAACALARVVEAPGVLPPAWPAAMRCRDASDQIFVELAVARAPACIVTQDRALLRMGKALRPHGVQVAAPGSVPVDGAPGADARPG